MRNRRFRKQFNVNFLILDRLRQTLFGSRQMSPEHVRLLLDAENFLEAKTAIQKLPAKLPNREAIAQSLLGEILFHEKQDEEARIAFGKALQLQPNEPAAHYGLSILMANTGDIHLATKHAQFAVNMAPGEPRFQAQLGYCNLKLGNALAAAQALRKSTQLDPNNAYALNNLGIVLGQLGDAQGAIHCFKRAIAIKPDFSTAANHLKLAMELAEIRGKNVAPGQGEDSSEIEHLEAKILAEPHNFQAASDLMMAYAQVGDPQSGIDTMTAWASINPDDQRPTKALGLLNLRIGSLDESERLLREYSTHDEKDIAITRALGEVLAKKFLFKEANPFIHAALEANPDDHELLGLYSANLSNLCRYQEALEVIDIAKSKGIHLSTQGSVLTYLGRFDEALQALDFQLRFQPHEPNLRMLRGSIHLLKENYGEGWDDYRYRTLMTSKQSRVLPFPEWDGQPLRGKRIVVLAEQGLGDQVMFASCLPDLVALKPDEVIVEVIDRVAETLTRSYPSIIFENTKQNQEINWLKKYQEFDYFVHLADLPRHFRRTPSDFPQHHGYLKTDPQKVDHWKKKISQWESNHFKESTPMHRLRIGISWRGGTPITREPARTLDLALLADFCHNFDATWVCLQYGKLSDDLSKAHQLGLEMAYWPESISNLDDFAAMIDGLDLIITVCNTTVHYSGAIDRPVWVMAPKVPEWRYGLHSTSMPWYPSSRVFRQPDHGDWQGLLKNVEEALKAHLSAQSC